MTRTASKIQRESLELASLLLVGFMPGISANYVLFDYDMGGTSNIQMGVMQASVVSKLLGRTLVLPPPEPWYMKDYAPNSFLGNLDEHDGGLRAPTSVSAFQDYFDMSEAGLGGFVKVITFDEFIRLESATLGLPWPVQQPHSNNTICTWTKLQGERLLGRNPEHVRGKYYQAYSQQWCRSGQANSADVSGTNIFFGKNRAVTA
jgi:hypothetical protein